MQNLSTFKTIKMYRRIIFIVLLSGLCLGIDAQVEKYMPYMSPLTPSSFQFLKYGEIPVSEYTGIPNITIPLYTIKSGDMELPLVLSYHAGGIKVADEASWVGLGWDFSVGSVSQIINDRDDLGNFTKVLPDYYFLGPPIYEFNWKYRWPESLPNPYGYPPSNGITEDNIGSSIITFTDFYIPINGQYEKNTSLFNSSTGGNDFVDSEPDVFKASFFGHYLEFIKDFNTGEIIVLNKSNYIVKQQSNTSGKAIWKITTPEGIQYFFDEINEVFKYYSATYVYNTLYTNSDGQPQSRIWHLTKVITPNNIQANFIYDKTSNTNNITSFSQKDRYFKSIRETRLSIWVLNATKTSNPDGTEGMDLGIRHEYSLYRSQPHTISYLSSIVFPEGNIVFTKSARSDKSGDKKLDKIVIYNIKSTNIKQIDFTYSNYMGHNNGGSAQKDYITYYSDKSITELTYRLKLDALKFTGENAYNFVYNSTVLPSKASYATDYWGYYNGKTSNTSFIPNPIHIGHEILGDNSNDHKSYIDYAKAGILEQIIYPTGGKTAFDYELNSFINQTYTPIKIGSGLRVKSITNWNNGLVAEKKEYSYANGKVMLPLNFFGHVSFNTYNGNQILDYDCDYISGNNFFCSSLLGSGQYIGYEKVTATNTDNSNNSNGKTISYYSNYADIVLHDDYTDISLPARKDHYFPENGLLETQIVLDAKGDTILWKHNEYDFRLSDIYYGAKTSYRNFLIARYYSMGAEFQATTEQDVVGFYPLYSGQSFLKFTENKDYKINGKIYTKQDYSYNTIDLINCTNSKNSEGESLTECYTYPFDNSDPYMNVLRAKNMLEHPVGINRFNNGSTKYSLKESYSDFGGLTLISKISERYDGHSDYQDILFDNYISTNGRLLQYHKEDDVNTVYLWGYNKLYMVAKIEGADYVSAIPLINQSLLDSPSSDAVLRTELAKLRTGLPNAMVTTYTYNPLIGITSETDANGKTTYYLYDTSGRLQYLKDQDSNIIQEYKYHYKE